MRQDDNATGQKLTPKKAAFLASYPVAGTVSAACGAAKISRSSHYQWLQGDDVYREAFEQAKIEVTESLEAEAVRRARDGWEEPVFHEGKICGFKRRFSDLLLIFLLKANRPDKYREAIRQEHSRLADPTGLPVIEVRYVSANGQPVDGNGVDKS